MADRHDTMMYPRIEHLLEATGSSKFRLVTVAARRARQINAYFNQLGEGLGSMVPPQVTSLARKPLSIAFEEIAAGKIVGVDIATLAAATEGEAAEEGPGSPDAAGGDAEG